MKKTIISISVVMILLSMVVVAQTFWGGKTMRPNQVKEKWGTEKLDLKKFKSADFSLKSKMAYAIMTNKDLIGKSYEYIEENFGTHDGFYFIDTYPAYIIQDGKTHAEETWQLVFRMDNHYKVRDIIMHKNCCEN